MDLSIFSWQKSMFILLVPTIPKEVLLWLLCFHSFPLIYKDVAFLPKRDYDVLAVWLIVGTPYRWWLDVRARGSWWKVFEIAPFGMCLLHSEKLKWCNILEMDSCWWVMASFWMLVSSAKRKSQMKRIKLVRDLSGAFACDIDELLSPAVKVFDLVGQVVD